MGVHPIILCGGPGSRLWPASTAARPKPFIDLIGGLSLFQRTVLRMKAVPGALAPVVVTGQDHAEEARTQLHAIGVEGMIIAEPVGRDSAPALIAAAMWIARLDPEAVAVAVASDHHIPDVAAFAAAVVEALPAAHAGDIVTFGIRPTFAATGYGYIRPGEPLGVQPSVRRIGRFVEKPDAARAQELVAEGCLWNSGNFMFRVDVLCGEATALAPDLAGAVARTLDLSVAKAGFLPLDASFAEAPRISIDVSVMEKTAHAAVLPIDYPWSDLGAWDAVLEASDHDEQGNSLNGVAAAVDSEGCLVRADQGARVLALGVRDLAIVVQGQDVLVSSLDRAGDLKTALVALETATRGRNRPGNRATASADLSVGARLKDWLWDQALPTWWCFGADHLGGGFHERLNQDLSPDWAARRIRVQARQTYVYAKAGLMGWPGPWTAAVDHGLGYLIARYRRPDGLFRSVVTPDGAPLVETATLYDQDFVLLALATAARALPARGPEFLALADIIAERVRSNLAGPAGGYRADEAGHSYLADPIMHLFEATLAWVEAGGGPRWRAWAVEIADLFINRMVDTVAGRIFEVFDEQWKPTPDLEGRKLEPGHQFEWAWLMERWSRLSGDARAHDIAIALRASGERGVDPATGLTVDDLLDDFSVYAGSSRLWPQTERVKANLILADGDPADAQVSMAAVRSAARALEAYLDSPRPGLWRDTPSPSDPGAGAPAPASSFYHIIGAIDALITGGVS